MNQGPRWTLLIKKNQCCKISRYCTFKPHLLWSYVASRLSQCDWTDPPPPICVSEPSPLVPTHLHYINLQKIASPHLPSRMGHSPDDFVLLATIWRCSRPRTAGSRPSHRRGLGCPPEMRLCQSGNVVVFFHLIHPPFLVRVWEASAFSILSTFSPVSSIT